MPWLCAIWELDLENWMVLDFRRKCQIIPRIVAEYEPNLCAIVCVPIARRRAWENECPGRVTAVKRGSPEETIWDEQDQSVGG